MAVWQGLLKWLSCFYFSPCGLPLHCRYVSPGVCVCVCVFYMSHFLIVVLTGEASGVWASGLTAANTLQTTAPVEEQLRLLLIDCSLIPCEATSAPLSALALLYWMRTHRSKYGEMSPGRPEPQLTDQPRVRRARMWEFDLLTQVIKLQMSWTSSRHNMENNHPFCHEANFRLSRWTR